LGTDARWRQTLLAVGQSPVFKGLYGLLVGVTLCQIVLGFAALIPVAVLEVTWRAFGARGQYLLVPAVLGSTIGAYAAFWIARGLARFGGFASSIVIAPTCFAVAFTALAAASWQWADVFGSFVLVPFIVAFFTFAVTFLLERRSSGHEAHVEQALQLDAPKLAHNGGDRRTS
jgi:hypothetical protein